MHVKFITYNVVNISAFIRKCLLKCVEFFQYDLVFVAI